MILKLKLCTFSLEFHLGQFDVINVLAIIYISKSQNDFKTRSQLHE